MSAGYHHIHPHTYTHIYIHTYTQQYTSWTISSHDGSSIPIGGSSELTMDPQYSSWIINTHHGSSTLIMDGQGSIWTNNNLQVLIWEGVDVWMCIWIWTTSTHDGPSVLIMDHQYLSAFRHVTNCISCSHFHLAKLHLVSLLIFLLSWRSFKTWT